jgi:uncharacterized protein YbaP (TraB family)
MRWKAFIVAALALLAAACHKEAPAPLPAKVALWEISDTSGTRGWIFGTVHALPAGVQWRRPAIDQALAGADRLVLEIAQPLDGNVAGVALARLAYTPGLPPPSQRVAMKYRDALAKVYKDLNLTDAQFQNEESWAVALQIAAIGGQKEGMDPASGVEPELRKLIGGKPVQGLETLDGQFGIFDALPEHAQQTLLEQIAVEAADDRDDDADMVRLWLTGCLPCSRRAAGWLDGLNRAAALAFSPQSAMGRRFPVMVIPGGVAEGKQNRFILEGNSHERDADPVG